MFETVFEKVTSYFNHRSLVSAFFPNLVFWILTVIIVVILQLGWDVAFKAWDRLGITAQILFAIAFLSWVTLCSFLTINFRTALIRLYEGYWTDTGLLGIIYHLRRRQWQKRWDKQYSMDRELGEQQGVLLTEKEEYDKLLNLAETQKWSMKHPPAEQAQQVENEFNKLLVGLQVYLKEVGTTPPSIRSLEQLGENIREQWRQINSQLTEDPQMQNTIWAQRYDQLAGCIWQLKDLLDQHYKEIEEQRLQHFHELFLYYPPERVNIMPTRLGNVLKSAEMYAQKRYHLDSVLAWPRLQSAIPVEFAESLRDAKTSLDLITTFSAFVLLFGLPLSIWVASKVSVLLPWWLPLLLGIIAFALRFYLSIALVLIALMLTFIPTLTTFPTTIILLGTVGGWWPTLAPSFTIFFIIVPLTTIAHLQIFVIILASSSLLSWLSYQNSIQAGLHYGEKVKAAFDLYRWKILEALHLQLPTDFKEECRIWDEVCRLLVRNSTPDSNYYCYVQQEQSKQSASDANTTALVPAKDIPVYHIITDEAITEIDISDTKVPLNAVQRKEDLVGQCTLKALPAHQPICRTNLIDPKRLEDTSALGIQATPSITLGGNLQIGDTVDIIITPTETKAKSSPVLFENLLVLDTKSIQEDTIVNNTESSRSSVVVLAMPLSRRMEFIMRSANGTLLLSRRISPSTT